MAPIRTTRHYLGWMLGQSSRLPAVIVAACVFIGLSVALRQADRQCNGVVHELRAVYERQEQIRRDQFTKLRDQMQSHLRRQDEDFTKARCELLEIVAKVDRLIGKIEAMDR